MEKHIIELELKLENMREFKEEINKYIEILEEAVKLANEIANRGF